MSKTKRNSDSEDRQWKTQPYKRERYSLNSFESEYIKQNEDATIHLKD